MYFSFVVWQKSLKLLHKYKHKKIISLEIIGLIKLNLLDFHICNRSYIVAVKS